MNRHITTDPAKRHYNQWVSNEMLEDCALRFTALKTRRWSCFQVANTALGSISFLALEAIGAAITVQYGWVNALAAITCVSVIIFILGIPIAVQSAKAGVDIDLLTRGAGFGYLGSTITSLIYAGFTFIFFALEAAIMATALQVCFDVPISLGYLICSLAVIPVVIYGITLISRLQRFTQHLWLMMQLAPFVFLAWQSIDPVEGWPGLGFPDINDTQTFNWIMFGAASAIVFSLIVQIGEQVDYLRFLPPRSKSNNTSWWIALIAAGPGWIVIGALKMIAGVYLCLLALEYGMSDVEAIDPVHLYVNAWANWIGADLALAVTGIFVIVCQFKINITNSYAGSIAWSNFFSRLTHSHPGRVVWLIFNVTIAWMLMELGVYKSLENTLSLYSILGISWIGAIAMDLAFNKTVGLSPRGVHFKRAELYDINPVGVGAMTIATFIGFIAYSGFWGAELRSFASYLSLFCVLLLVPLLAWITGGRYYLASSPTDLHHSALQRTGRMCCICRNSFDTQDLIHCPAYQGTICSLCCSLDTRCEDLCRPNAPFLAQLRHWTQSILPKQSTSDKQWLILQFICLVLVAAAILAFLFALVYLQSQMMTEINSAVLISFLQNLFAALLVLAAIVTWMFLLASESAQRARKDTVRQNELLQQEINAHKVTETALNKAREKAEAANEAKSRYVIGLSHELRTPLSSILGYAQLMEEDTDLPDHRRNSVRVIRDSAQHLSGLIENLLDISRIEADRLTIHRDRVNLHSFLDQLLQMFHIQAETASLDFRISISSHVPEWVIADEKRLRQILINLLSNAFKYTRVGYVQLLVDYRSQVTTFRVNDTGPGISGVNLDRIYQPFETLPEINKDMPKGTGLGLTISKLLADIMGGDLTATSTTGKGSCFTLKLLLPPIDGDISQPLVVSETDRQTFAQTLVVIVDDDENHRGLLTDFLIPKGFRVQTFPNAESCLAAMDSLHAEVFLLDISMPGMNGWELARRIRSRFKGPVHVLMISALVDDQARHNIEYTRNENYFVKPLDLAKLLSRLRELLNPKTKSEDADSLSRATTKDSRYRLSNPSERTRNAPSYPIRFRRVNGQQVNKSAIIPDELLAQLTYLHTIGHISAINHVLRHAQDAYPGTSVFIENARSLIERHQLEAFGALLESTSGQNHD